MNSLTEYYERKDEWNVVSEVFFHLGNFHQTASVEIKGKMFNSASTVQGSRPKREHYTVPVISLRARFSSVRKHTDFNERRKRCRSWLMHNEETETP